MLITQQLASYFSSYNSLDGVRSRYSGRQIFIEIFLGFDAGKSLGEIQTVMDGIKQHLEEAIPYAEVTIIPRAR